MTEFMMVVLAFIPLEALPDQPSPTPPAAAYPRGSQGFAAYILGGFFGLGILVLAMVLLNHRPRRVDRRSPDQ
jgi:hypothetical protein